MVIVNSLLLSFAYFCCGTCCVNATPETKAAEKNFVRRVNLDINDNEKNFQLSVVLEVL